MMMMMMIIIIITLSELLARALERVHGGHREDFLTGTVA